MFRFAWRCFWVALTTLAPLPVWADDAKDKPAKAEEPQPPQPPQPPPPNGRYQSVLIPQSELKGAVVPPVFIIFDTATGATKACSITQTYNGSARFSVNC